MSTISPSVPKASSTPQSSFVRHWSDYALLVGVLIAAAFFAIGAPAGVDPRGWHALGLLIPVIIIWATEAIPSGMASVFFLAIIVGFQIVKPGTAFAGFTTHLPWLMAGAFVLGAAMEQSGFSKRMTYWLLSRLRGVWGLVIAAYASNIFLIGVPSSSARAAILAPILNSIMSSIGRPTDSKLSRFLSFNFINATVNLLSVLSLTGGAANVVMLALYTQLTGKTLGWTEWLVLMFLPTIILMGATCAASAMFAWPEAELAAKLQDSAAAKEAYAKLGPMTANEWKVVGMFVLVVLLWVTGSWTHWDPGFVAIFVAGLLFVPDIGVLKPKAVRDVNWDIFMLIGAVIGIAGILNETGMIKVVSDALIGPVLNPLAHWGLPGIAIGAIIVSLVAHFLLPSPSNLTLALPLLITWGTQTMHLPADVVLAFLAMVSVLGNLMVVLAYQMPPDYIFLGMEVTDTRKFNGLLIAIYPIACVAIFICAYVIYWTIHITGFGV